MMRRVSAALTLGGFVAVFVVVLVFGILGEGPRGLHCDETVSPGDGTLQAAFDRLGDKGGTICLKQGTYSNEYERGRSAGREEIAAQWRGRAWVAYKSPQAALDAVPDNGLVQTMWGDCFELSETLRVGEKAITLNGGGAIFTDKCPPVKWSGFPASGDPVTNAAILLSEDATLKR